MHKLLQTYLVFMCSDDLPPASVILKRQEAAGGKHIGERILGFNLRLPGERGYYSNGFYSSSEMIRKLKRLPISTDPFFLNSCNKIMVLFVTAVTWSK